MGKSMLLRITLVTKRRRTVEAPRRLWIPACFRRGVTWWRHSVACAPQAHLRAGCLLGFRKLRADPGTTRYLFTPVLKSSVIVPEFPGKKKSRFRYDPPSEGLLPGFELRSGEWNLLAWLTWTTSPTHSPGQHGREESASRAHGTATAGSRGAEGRLPPQGSGVRTMGRASGWAVSGSDVCAQGPSAVPQLSLPLTRTHLGG